MCVDSGSKLEHGPIREGQPLTIAGDASQDSCVQPGPFLTNSPVNPRLPWPRYEPPVLGLPATLCDSLPPTQRFQVHLPTLDDGTCSTQQPCKSAQVSHEVTVHAPDEIPGRAMPSCPSDAAEVPCVKSWTPGGLRGGAFDAIHDKYYPDEFWRVMPCGWWLHVWQKRWIKIPLDFVRGRTVRQERETLGLGGIDVTSNHIFVLSTQGLMQVRWDYKFPITAYDSAAIVVAPADVSMSNVQECLDSPTDMKLPCPCAQPLCHDLQDNEDADWNVSPMKPTASPAHFRALQTSPQDGKLPHAPRVTRASMPEIPGVTPLSDAAFFVFLGGAWRCTRRQEGKTIAQTVEEEWGIAVEDVRFMLQGKCLSPFTLMTSLPLGLPVRLVGRLRGGVPPHSKKLRELLLSKGVQEDEVSSRISEICTAIGEPAIAEAFACFDPWQALKSKCQGKLRIIKQSEARGSKSKKKDSEEDRLQIEDPWAEALQHRHLKPEASFFHTASKEPPNILQTVTHGCSGLAIVDLQEAELLARSKLDLSQTSLPLSHGEIRTFPMPSDRAGAYNSPVLM